MHNPAKNSDSYPDISRRESIGIISGDPRQEFLFGLLKKEQLPVVWIEQPQKSSLFACKNIIAAVPFTKDQKTLSSHPELSIDAFLSFFHPGQTIFGWGLPQKVREFCRNHEVGFYDFADDDDIAKKNAVATAEGAVCEAITASPVNLEGSLCLLSGYGCCGQVIAKKLKALGAEVTVFECCPKRESLAKKEGFPCVQSHALIHFMENHPVLFVFNTAPCPVFTEEILVKLPLDSTIIDIATAPGGTDFACCKRLKKTARLCPGLPGKYAPKASAQILYDAVLSYLSAVQGQHSRTAT